MNTSKIRSKYVPLFTSFAALCFPLFEANAQTGDESANGVHVISRAHPVWLVEQADDESLGLTARTYGDSAYGGYHVKANLQISCHPQNPVASVSLQIAPAPLGFDSDPFEGPGATADGPLRITSGTRAGVDHRVSGIWTDGGVFQLGTIFDFSAAVPRDELAYWASDASRGQALTLSLAPAKAGGKPLIATFSLPKNNDGLKKVIQPCLGAVAATPVKP